MKNHTKSVLLLTVLCTALAGSLPAASTFDPAKIYAVGAIDRYGVTAVLPGSSAIRVAAHLGQPDEKLTPDTWVYTRFQCQPGLQGADQCTTLVISFHQGRVATLQRTNEAGIKLIAAQLPLPSNSARMVADKK